jgi:hypothetical protein
VGRTEHRHPRPGEFAHHTQHLADELGVERGGRLVEQHQLGAHRERSGDTDSLLLAAGELARIGICLVGETDPAKMLVPQLSCRLAGEPPDDSWAKRDVAKCGTVGEQVELLEHHPDAPSQLVLVEPR